MNFFNKKKLPKKPKFIFTTRNIARDTGNGDRISESAGFYDSQSAFLQYAVTVDSLANTSTNGSSFQQSAFRGIPAEAPRVLPDERKEVNPKDVFTEIKEESPEIDFSNLDEKIAAVTERLDILSEHLDEEHLMDEHRALFYLKNRKKYLKIRAKSPIDWVMTTREAVDDLCRRYKLITVPLKQYYTLIPKDGIKELNRYSKVYKVITGDNPIFELVIKDVAAIKPEEAIGAKKKDRDPILLANSPLGNHLFILGAWDEEVAIVDEIIYEKK